MVRAGSSAQAQALAYGSALVDLSGPSHVAGLAFDGGVEQETGDRIVHGVAVVLVEHVVQIARERRQRRVRQRGCDVSGVRERHDRVGLAVHEQHGSIRPSSGETGLDLRPDLGDGQHCLASKASLVDQRIVEQGMDIAGMRAQLAVGSRSSVSVDSEARTS